MNILQQSLLTSSERTVQILDLFDIDYKSKYLMVNLFSETRFGDDSDFAYGAKTIKNSYFFPNIVGKTVVYTLKNGDYINGVYGSLSNLSIKTSTNLNNLDVVTVKTVEWYDPSYYGLVLDTQSVFHDSVIGNEYSVSILNTTETKKAASIANVISLAQSYVGKTWNLSNPWSLANTIAAKIGTSLPVSSSGYTEHSSSNGSWYLKYDGNNPKGDWRTMVSPGDIIMMSSFYLDVNTVAIATSGQGESIKVIDTSISSNNLIGNKSVKIIPEHYLSSEDVYDLAPDSHVFIYSLNASSVTIKQIPINQPIKLSSYVTVISSVTPAVSYQVYDKLGAYSSTPKDLTSLNATATIPAGDTLFVRAYNGINWSDWGEYSTPSPIIVPVLSSESSNSPYIIKGAVNSINVNPMSDLSYGSSQIFSKQITGFTCTNPLIKLKLTIDGLPSWCKFDSKNMIISGTTPVNSGTYTLKLNAAYGNTKAVDTLKIVIDSSKLVDIKDVIWTANKFTSISIDKGLDSPYYVKFANAVDSKWLTLDQTTDTISGKPPLDLIGHTATLTVYQKAYSTAPMENVDTFSIYIDNPINIVGSPLLT